MTSGSQIELGKKPEAQAISFLILCLLAFCKAGDISMVLLIQIHCRRCGLIFCICRRCWRGQAYCSDECRITSRRQAHREAQRRYRQTERGRHIRRKAEQRRRKRICKKNVDDRGSTPQTPGYKIVSSWIKSSVRDFLVCVKLKIGEKGSCHFCGTSGLIVEKFPRRGYGKRTWSAGLPGL